MKGFVFPVVLVFLLAGCISISESEDSSKFQDDVKINKTSTTSIGINSYSDCFSINESRLVDNCLRVFAVRKKAYKICNEIKSIKVREVCYRQVGRKKKSLKICNMISENLREKDRCYRDVAVIRKNPGICEMINYSLRYRDLCFQGVGARLKETYLCDEIISPGRKTICYSSVSVGLNDSSICADLNVSSADSCLFYFSRNTDQVDSCMGISNDSVRSKCLEKEVSEFKGKVHLKRIMLLLGFLLLVLLAYFILTKVMAGS